MNELLDELKKIQKQINETPLVIENEKNEDGRIISLLYEKTVAEEITKKFKNITLKKSNRSFGDIFININGKEYPINIKLTSEKNKSNDNLVGMGSIMGYIFFNNKRINNHNLIAKKIKNNEISNVENDYGFISITKETGKAIVSTMLTMEGYSVNPINGFQANFEKIKTVDKSFEEGRRYMLNKYKEYLRKKAEAYFIIEGKNIES